MSKIVRCSRCGRPWPVDENRICEHCRKKIEAESVFIDRLCDIGHSPECAARLVGGDGKCQCGCTEK